MPPPRDHDANKQRICGVCFLKQKSVRQISDADLKNIRDTVFGNYHKENWTWLPDVICLTCHRAVFNAAAKKPGSTVNHIDFSQLRAPTAPRPTRDTTEAQRPDQCPCTVCWVSRMDFNEYRAFEKRMKEPVGRPRIYPEEEPEPVMICSKCQGEYGRGKPHNNCNASGRKANIVAVINDSDMRSREQMLSEQLRNVMSDQGASTSKGVGTITLATTGGRGGKLEVAAAASNVLQKPPVVFSHEAMRRIQLMMGASDRGMRHLSRFIRVHEGRTSVEPFFAEAMRERNKKYDHFFDQKMIKFTEYVTPEEEAGEGEKGEKKKKKKKETREVTKPLAYCTDVDGLAAEAMIQRGLNPERTKIQVGIDDGQGLVRSYHYAA